MCQQNLSVFYLKEVLEKILKLAKEDGDRIPVFYIWFSGATKFEDFQGVQEIIINEERGDFTIKRVKKTETHSLYAVQGIKYFEKNGKNKEAARECE